MTTTIVVALGGNALVSAGHESILDQLGAVEAMAPGIVDLAASGHRVVVTHGNGPQVGYILRRSELSLPEVAPVPIDFAVADTQGAIGHMFVLALRNELRSRALQQRVVAIVTNVVVDADDPAFAAPTKPIGSMFSEAKAKELAAGFGWSVAEDSGRGWRRVVASPSPLAVPESATIAALLDAGHVVIAGGGGGVPVTCAPDGTYARVEAVVDKDLTSALLAAELGADTLAIVTTVDRVAVGFGGPDERWLSVVDAAEMRRHLRNGSFGAGSMAPKVQAALRFVETPGPTLRRAVITSADRLTAAIRDARQAGTTIVP